MQVPDRSRSRSSKRARSCATRASRRRSSCSPSRFPTPPAARYDMVRIGIGVYGIPPAPALADAIALRPAMALKAHVSHVQRLAAGERVSYGLRWRAERATSVATVPAGYADGVPRELS